MAGDRTSYRGRGLIPRTIATVLARLAEAPGLASWSLSISYLEIYNEALYDLLDITSQPHELSLYEDGRGHVQVRQQQGHSRQQEAEHSRRTSCMPRCDADRQVIGQVCRAWLSFCHPVGQTV